MKGTRTNQTREKRIENKFTAMNPGLRTSKPMMTDLRSNDLPGWRAVQHGNCLRRCPCLPRKPLHLSPHVVETRVPVECPSRSQGTSCDHTTQESWQRVCTIGSGNAPERRNPLCDSTGSVVAVRATLRHPVIEPRALRPPQKHPALGTSYAMHLPKPRALRFSQTSYTPCIHAQDLDPTLES